MPLKLFNTLTRAVDPFTPLTAGRVSMYTCGPTVYNYAHIGNFRTFLFEDLLRRWLEASGYEVLHVMNLTDVDDKTIKGAKAAGKKLTAHTKTFADAFFEDCAYLRIRPATEYPKATDYIGPMVKLVEGLLANGTAYKGEDGSVYFAIAKFPAYGRLSRLDTRELKSGASGRVSADEYAKEDARDFVLWKGAQPEDEEVGAAWDAPFGRGRPGWHLECSAMALDILGRTWGEKVLDIHAGGVDLTFPHHEDEIAQSCAYTGEKDFARVWMHGEFLTMSGTKMSKRFGNILTARDLAEQGIDAAAVRLLVFQTHYRQPLDFTDDSLAAAQQATRRIAGLAERLAGPGGKGDPAALVAAAEILKRDATAALDDDLNAPRAVAALFDFVTAANRALDAGSAIPAEAREAWAWAMGVLDVVPGPAKVDGELAAWVEGKLAERLEARRGRDFARADALRKEVEARGVEIEDTPTGPKWRMR
ncbi:MAG TPA: cysteine--tRNA ligase [Gemmatimonadales bacterium]|nr:cysteine--tRNA ligase [Gemmatimonadales bacterium]